MSRMCSQCGNNGHNSRTCSDASGGASGGAGASGSNTGIMLFGVRLTEGPFRKSASMNNLVQYEQQPQDSNPDAAAADYDSDDVVHASARSGERKRGVPWTEEEHRRFLIGLQKVGKGDWRGISRNFVKTRTPTQVASHAQKYFLRLNNHNRRRRRSSLFDITTDPYMDSATGENRIQPRNLASIPINPIPPSSKMAGLNQNQTPNAYLLPLSLKLSISPPPPLPPPPPPPEYHSPAARRPSSFQAMPDSLNSSSGDSVISVA
ncbi:transcription factor MYBS3 [Diospyros lotus]|uniref:transcription factor MYBS3 n=1 Tax=Diospyros lotus TaxID=55363 RepID=UPI00225B4020|nr:transcription factor MYBS3 [Diospyros lotus]